MGGAQAPESYFISNWNKTPHHVVKASMGKRYNAFWKNSFSVSDNDANKVKIVNHICSVIEAKALKFKVKIICNKPFETQ